jgi:hypothetical protein
MPATIVLLHAAFVDSSSWDAGIDGLLDAGHPGTAAANPLRGIATDAVDRPIVPVAHSHGVEVPDGSYVIAVSRPNEIAHLMLEAAASRVTA